MPAFSPHPPSVGAAAPATRRPLVLIAEQHDDTRDMLRTLLEVHGFDIAECADGREVLPTIERTRPAVVLLNSTLNGLDGLTVARRIHTAEVGLPRPRLVFMSTEGGRAPAAAVQAAGCDSFFLKPIDLVELLAVVRRLVADGEEAVQAVTEH